MKIFISKIALMLIILAALMAGIWACPGVYTIEFSAIVNKIDMLKSKQPPRIIFIGGSNLLTIDSKLIQKKFKRPVVNLGLWYGLNYKYFLEEVKALFKPGDTIIFIIEYSAFSFDLVHKVNTESKEMLLLLSPISQLKAYLRNFQIIDGFKIFIEVIQQKAKSALQNIRVGKWHRLMRTGLQDYENIYDENGSIKISWPIIRPLRKINIPYPSNFQKNWSFLNDFWKFARKNDIKIFLTFSPYPIEHYTENKKNIAAIDKCLRKFCKIQILGKPENFLIHQNYFRDSPFHIYGEGEKQRTREIIRLLDQEMIEE